MIQISPGLSSSGLKRSQTNHYLLLPTLPLLPPLFHIFDPFCLASRLYFFSTNELFQFSFYLLNSAQDNGRSPNQTYVARAV
jgi:hypothetical protein